MTPQHDHRRHETLIDYWRVIVIRRYVVLAAFAAGVLIATAVGYSLTPIYRATALVIVEDDTSRLIGVQLLYPSDVTHDRHYRTQSTLIRNRAVLRAAAARLRLEEWEEFSGARDVVAALAGRVKARHVTNTKLIEVSFEGPDKTRVAEVANAVVECFREESVRQRKQSSDFATGWIEEQLPRFSAELIEAERRLQEFQEKNKIVSLDSSHSTVSQYLLLLNKDADDVERARIELEADLVEFRAALADPQAVGFLPIIAQNPAIREIDSQILALDKERLGLLQTVRADHRDLLAYDAQIAELEAKRDARVRSALTALERRLEAVKAKEES